jgi:hypothetical protein
MDPRATFLEMWHRGPWRRRGPTDFRERKQGLTTEEPSTPRSHQAKNSPPHNICGSAAESTPRPRRMRPSASVLKKQIAEPRVRPRRHRVALGIPCPRKRTRSRVSAPHTAFGQVLRVHHRRSCWTISLCTCQSKYVGSDPDRSCWSSC